MRNSSDVAAARSGHEEIERRAQHAVLRTLIWTYFVLIILEGPLRKWILPNLANQLILVRDPILLLIYVAAIGSGAFHGHWITMLLVGVGALATVAAIFTGHGNLGVALYGLDANFLHLPLIFIIGGTMNKRDVVNWGRWVLYLTIPMAILMAMQFRANPNDFVNVGPGASPGSQMMSVLGKIRPPGLFTFVTGAAMFLSLAAAFVIFGFLEKLRYHHVFLTVCSLALVVSTAVSSSRLALGGISVVFLMIGVIGLYNRAVVQGALSMLVPLGIVFLIATNLDVFQEGTHVFETRLELTGDANTNIVQTASTWSERVLGDFISGFKAAEGTPIMGRGIGYGTNIGARLLTGQVQYMADEREWGRVVIEMGVLLGVPYLLARVAIFLRLFIAAARSARAGNFLPMLLFGSCGLGLLNGQFGVAATLGFTVFQAGMCLAANRTEAVASETSSEPETVSASIKRRRGRSRYAAALHADVHEPPPGL